MQLSIKTRPNGTLYATLDWPHLEAIILAELCWRLEAQEPNVHFDVDALKVTIRRWEEGSPAYSVDKWTAEIRSEVDIEAVAGSNASSMTAA